MDSDIVSQKSNVLIIRKSAIVMFLRLLIFELVTGALYILLRLSLRAVDIQLDSELSVSLLSLSKSFFFLLIELSVAGYVILQWLNNYYVLTSSEVRYVSGILSKREMNYSLKNIQSVSFEQGVIGRILGYGSVKMFSPALQQELFLTEVSNPEQVVDNVKKMIESDTGETKFIMRR